jgi:flavin-dependent dehydrogenase
MSSASKYDLIVVGGGPAGTAAAIVTGRKGRRVLLLERGRFPRHKVCGEFVSAECLALLKVLLDPRHAALLRDAVTIPGARLFLDSRTLSTVIDPSAASIARLDLDLALWESAESAGVDARQQVSVRSVVGTGPFRVATSAGEFESRAVINASGRWSNLHASAGKAAQPERWIGIKAHFSEPSPNPSVDLYFFDGGYCGVQPVELNAAHSGNGRVNACAMVRANVASTLPDVFARHPALRERSLRWQPLSDPVSTSPLIFRKPHPQRDGTLMAGDAAGFVDPFVGDGISLAVRSASLAAECLIPFFAGEISLQHSLQRYRESYDQRLAPIFRASSTLRRMLVLPRAIRIPLWFLLTKTPSIARYVVGKTR